MTKLSEAKDFSLCCQCCNLPLVDFIQHAPKFGIGCNVYDFRELGVAFPLFFYLLQAFGLVLLVCSLVAGLPCLLANVSQREGGDWGHGSGAWYINISLGGYGSAKDIPAWQPILHCSVAMFIALVILILKRRTYNKIIEIDLSEITPSDFAIVITGLENNFSEEYEKQVILGLEKLGGKVHSVCYVYDIREYVDNISKQNNLKNQIYRIRVNQETGKRHPESGCYCCKSKD